MAQAFPSGDSAYPDSDQAYSKPQGTQVAGGGGDASVIARREVIAQINRHKFDLHNTPGMNGDDQANLSIKIRELQEQLQGMGGMKRY